MAAISVRYGSCSIYTFYMTYKKIPFKITCAFVLLSCIFVYLSCNTGSSPYNHTTWSQYGGGSDQSKYFDATEITPQNVSQLQVAWSYSTEDNIPYMFQPVVVDTTMYVMGKIPRLLP